MGYDDRVTLNLTRRGHDELKKKPSPSKLKLNAKLLIQTSWTP